MRLPTNDTLGGYGLGKYRPVYFVTGKSQGLGKYKNRTTGVSSTAAKFSSSFALGAKIFQQYDAKFADQMRFKSRKAWDFAKSDLGNCQTACMVSPYFYEEDNYVDDTEMYNQIADDRDHMGMRLPTNDTLRRIVTGKQIGRAHV